MKFFAKLGLAIVHALALGVSFTMLWGWFLVPLGVPEISPSHAYGIVTLASLPFAPAFVLLLEDESRPWWTMPTVGIVCSLLALLVGWICQMGT